MGWIIMHKQVRQQSVFGKVKPSTASKKDKRPDLGVLEGCGVRDSALEKFYEVLPEKKFLQTYFKSTALEI